MSKQILIGEVIEEPDFQCEPHRLWMVNELSDTTRENEDEFDEDDFDDDFEDDFEEELDDDDSEDDFDQDLSDKEDEDSE